MISPLFTTIVLVAAFIWIYIKITMKDVGKGTREYIDREVLADKVRKQPLHDLPYIDFNENSINFIDPAPNDKIAAIYDTLHTLMVGKIVNLSGTLNTDLKFSYGAANLPILTEYDQNFTSLTKNLYDLGLALIDEGLISEAVNVLTYAVNIGTDISGVYLTLANIYVESEEYDKINHLIKSAENIHSILKDSTVSKLTEILDTHTAIVIAHPVEIAEAVNKAPDTLNISLEDIPAENIDGNSILPQDVLDILDYVNDISNN